MRNFFNGLLGFFSSYGLAAVLFLFLLLLTYLGTLEQIEHGLYATQKKYFESLMVVHHFGKLPVVLPGVYLLLILLSVNIVCGGILRIRKGWNQAGVLISHSVILLLLLGGYITFQYSQRGHMTLYEGQQSNVVVSYHEWEVALTSPLPDGGKREVVLPQEVFEGPATHGSKTVRAEALPFDLVLSGFAPNANPRSGSGAVRREKVVDGFFLQPMPLEKEQERNVAGIYATFTEKATGQQHDVLLWGLQQYPAKLILGGEEWSADLRRKQWQVPFTIHLDKFTRELHPGTNMPRAFMSDVTKVEDGLTQQIKISMNQPLRHKGLTFYQASWGPQNAGPNDPLFSSFAVSRNPADKFPLYACIVITFGMALHFIMKLRRYLRREMQRSV